MAPPNSPFQRSKELRGRGLSGAEVKAQLMKEGVDEELASLLVEDYRTSAEVAKLRPTGVKPILAPEHVAPPTSSAKSDGFPLKLAFSIGLILVGIVLRAVRSSEESADGAVSGSGWLFIAFGVYRLVRVIRRHNAAQGS